jgi:hypothetical protein
MRRDATSPTCSHPGSRNGAGLLAEAESIISDLRAAQVVGRLLGGVAIALRCTSARPPGPFARSYSDLDIAVDGKAGAALATVLDAYGYVGDKRFNALHGRRRMLFSRADGAHIDVLVERFAMCHELELASRLAVHPFTVSLADLLLMKLQVAEINRKDVTDIGALLLDHALTDDESGINATYVCELLGRDWGWWRTATENLATARAYLDEVIVGGAAREAATSRLETLMARIEGTPKSVRWRMRARVGERVPWRVDPEEVTN